MLEVMQSIRLVIFGLLLASCGGTVRDGQEPSAPARDLKREADRGETAARPESGTAPAPALACGDMVLNDQLSSGGEQLTHVVPCAPVPQPTPAPARQAIPGRSDAPAVTPDANGPTPVGTPTEPKPKKKGPAIQAQLPPKQ